MRKPPSAYISRGNLRCEIQVAFMGNTGEIYWWNSFDVNTALFFNQFAGRHPWLDLIVGSADMMPLVKGGMIVLLIWFVLFERNRPGQLRDGFELLIGAVFISAFATIAARGLALCLPFRTRPYVTPALHFQLPGGGRLDHFDWSSFPSDHAVMFFALATGILMVSRKLGWFAIAWAALIVCIPRLYMGEHWPTDILAGAVIGVASSQLARIPAFRGYVRRTITVWRQEHPGIFFAVLFLWSYEIVNLFGDVRHLLKMAAHSI